MCRKEKSWSTVHSKGGGSGVGLYRVKLSILPLNLCTTKSHQQVFIALTSQIPHLWNKHNNSVHLKICCEITRDTACKTKLEHNLAYSKYSINVQYYDFVSRSIANSSKNEDKPNVFLLLDYHGLQWWWCPCCTRLEMRDYTPISSTLLNNPVR